MQSQLDQLTTSWERNTQRRKAWYTPKEVEPRIRRLWNGSSFVPLYGLQVPVALGGT